MANALVVLTERSRLFSKLAVCTPSASHIASHPMSGNLPMLMRQEEERAGTSLDNYHRQTQCTLDLRSPSLPQNNLQYIAILEVLSDGEMHVVLDNMKWPQ